MNHNIMPKLRSKAIYPYLLLAPALLFIALTVFFPLARGFHLSFQHYVLTEPHNIYFAGLDNFRRALKDPYFFMVLTQSFLWVTGSILFQFILGFILALLLNEEFKGRSLYRAIILSPWAIASVITGIMWMWMFDGQIGVINDLLLKLGIISQRIPWLARRSTALPSVIIANIWRGIPFFAIMLLAALQSIPLELYESASIDGANAYYKFRYITLPLVRSMIIVAILLRVIWTFNYVDLIYVMTAGGPAFSSNTLASYTFLTAYTMLDFGYAGALSVILFLILMAFTIIFLKVSKFEESRL